MKFQHQALSSTGWYSLSLMEQMANIGSEVERTILWRKKGNHAYSRMALERALELIYLTIADSKNKNRLKELTRLRELLLDYFWEDNQFSSSDMFWHKYFYNFAYAVRAKPKTGQI